MPRLSKKMKMLWAFFIDPVTGRRSYNDTCRKCAKPCKQSYRTILVDCSRYTSKSHLKMVCKSNEKGG